MKVLVVDDEPMIRDLAEKILLRAGLEVETADCGASATACLHASPRLIDLVLLDLTLGDISGLDILTDIRTLCPTLPVILSSGDALSQIRLPAHLANHTRLLEKPYRSSQLVVLAKEMLAL